MAENADARSAESVAARWLRERYAAFLTPNEALTYDWMVDAHELLGLLYKTVPESGESVRLPIEGPNAEMLGFATLTTEAAEAIADNPDDWCLTAVTNRAASGVRLVGLLLTPSPGTLGR